MTALIGIRCTDGVIIGSDSSATFGVGPTFRTIEQKIKKVFVIEDKYIIAGTGQVGMNQRICNTVKVLYDQKAFRDKSEHETMRLIVEAAYKDFVSTQAQRGSYGALVAFAIKSKFHLVELGIADLQPEFRLDDCWFSSMGSGQAITDPFLALMKNAFAPNGPPNLQDGLFMAAWALDHVIELNPGGINGPVQLAVLERGKKDSEYTARMLGEHDIEEHLVSARAAVKHLGEFRRAVQAQDSPAVPRPPAAEPVPAPDKD